ncbi:MAG TPA: type II toxin-antitoxin system Phd/YefM family antitoxin [Isosphaeraceae bacterium]|nr:type II toxin-antitoxin system Phd/YefM family antitoxin [Isosphaeraceae bacterium]
MSRDIHPLTDFKRNTPAFLRQLKESGYPLVLTVNGKAEIVVMPNPISVCSTWRSGWKPSRR